MNEPLLRAIRMVSAAALLGVFAAIHLLVMIPYWLERPPEWGTVNKNVESAAATLNGFVLSVAAILCGVKVVSGGGARTWLGYLGVAVRVGESPDWTAIIRACYVWTYLGIGVLAFVTLLVFPDVHGMISTLGWGALAFVLALSRAFFPELGPDNPATPGAG